MANFGPLTAEIRWRVWGTPGNFNGFRVLPRDIANSLCVQILCSPILAALLHGTPAVGVSQTLRCGTRNGITELPQRAPPIFGCEQSE